MITQQNKIYQKLFRSHTCIILMVVIVLESYFYISIRNKAIQDLRESLGRETTQVSHYFTLLKENTDLLIQLMYQSEAQVVDIMSYLEEDIQTYLEKKLDRLYSQKNIQSEDMTDYINKVFRIHSALDSVAFISEVNEKMIVYTKGGNVFTEEINLKEGELYDYKVIFLDGKIGFVKILYQPITYEKKGYMITTYDLSGLKEYEKHKLFIGTTKGQKIYGNKEIERLVANNIKNGLLRQEVFEDKIKSYINVTYHDMGLMIITGEEKKNVKIPIIVYMTLIFLGVSIFGIGEYLVYLKLEKLSRRTNAILVGMEKVKQGDFDVILNIEKENDELDILAGHFNTMCYELKDHITKSLMLEIEQQQAEIKALQSQINPHFLYNTLEAIRMRAICNGDKEVSKMIYSLAVLFRGQIKENDQITLSKELHYCKKYMEIFTFRYDNQFTFDFEYKQEDLECLVIKFMIQPIIENYFVHGIRLEEANNYLKVNIKTEGDLLYIRIEDNGRGITLKRLEELNLQLKRKNSKPGESIGIVNVHRRIQMVYGKQYGLAFENNKPSGVSVLMIMPVIKEEVMNVSSDVSR